MKKILLVTATIFAAIQVFAARMYPATGQVVDEQGQAIEYATVVLLNGLAQVTGMTTDTEGRFELKVAPGNYTLSIQYLGYDPLTRPVQVEQDNDLGQLVMKSSSTQIEGVVVKGLLIRREADRFVVNVANTPAAMGKDGIELLEQAPGVWIDGEKITINGKSGSKVYVNDRELRMEPEQLLNYLRTLRSDNIQKIEVVPTVGADYDANATGGVIRITLRKRRENGTEGNVSLNTRLGEFRNTISPSVRINHHSGKLDLFAMVWGNVQRTKMFSDEDTRYTTGSATLKSHSKMIENRRNFGVDVGAVYEINDRHSIGGEFEYWRDSEKSHNDSYTDFSEGDMLTHTDSRYGYHDRGNNYTATFNYIWKIDTLGSTLKVLADYNRRQSEVPSNNRSLIKSPVSTVDSLYRDHAASTYNVTTATLALEKYFSPRWSLRAGAKYTYNDMGNNALYEYLKNDVWVRNDEQSFTLNYTENIAAAYGIVSANLKRWNLVVGVRGEYTHTYGKGGAVAQNYFSLFPNATVSYKLSKDGAYSLIAQYGRTIERPRFWAMNPRRMQLSDYSYQTGNPYLDPSYTEDISLTFVLKHKFTFTAGVTLKSGEIQQTMLPDTDDPDRLLLTYINFDRTQSYYATANLPFQLAKWWTLTLNATYMRQGQRIEPHTRQKNFNFVFANAATTFTLPAKFFIDLSYNINNRLYFGNCWVEPQHRLTAAVKKRFGERFTATFSVSNLLDEGQQIGARGEGFVRLLDVKEPWNSRIYMLGVTYNFKSGKAFKHKSVEAGSADEKNRL